MKLRILRYHGLWCVTIRRKDWKTHKGVWSTACKDKGLIRAFKQAYRILN